jgi:hypothetical protein
MVRARDSQGPPLTLTEKSPEGTMVTALGVHHAPSRSCGSRSPLDSLPAHIGKANSMRKSASSSGGARLRAP